MVPEIDIDIDGQFPISGKYISPTCIALVLPTLIVLRALIPLL